MKKTLLMILALILVIASVPVRANAAATQMKAGAVTTTSSRLNVRSAASTASPVISSLKKGSYITLLSNSGSWWKVEYGKGQQGYCHSAYITVVEGTQASVVTNGGKLNVRSGAGTGYSIKAQLDNREDVLLLSEKNGWGRVLYHGTQTGYVSMAYISTGSTNTIRLNVPSYKQNDSRWANVKLGSSGKTISQIGCATTAIAMMESYRTGTVIYPDAMSKKLTYTSSGSVYWPSNFVAVTDQTAYLSTIHRLLQQNKPVLLGAKTSAGSQHWVVITGFTGGSLSAANFTINDPGSNSRTTLAQFLNEYPVFYKYFYYQ